MPRARLSLDISADVRAQMFRLKGWTGAGSITEVVRRALIMYEECVKSQRLGTKIVFRAHDGKESTIMPL